jgi:hypothetical protein
MLYLHDGGRKAFTRCNLPRGLVGVLSLASALLLLVSSAEYDEQERRSTERVSTLDLWSCGDAFGVHRRCQTIWDCEASEYAFSRSAKLLVKYTWKGASRTIEEYLRCKLPDYEMYRGALLRDSETCMSKDGMPNVFVASDIAEYASVGVAREPMSRFVSGMATMLSREYPGHRLGADLRKANVSFGAFMMRSNAADHSSGSSPSGGTWPSPQARQCFGEANDAPPSWDAAQAAYEEMPSDRHRAFALLDAFVRATVAHEQYGSWEGGGSNHILPAVSTMLTRFVAPAEHATARQLHSYDRIIRVESLSTDLESLDALLPESSRARKCEVNKIRSYAQGPMYYRFQKQALELLRTNVNLARPLCDFYRQDYACFGYRLPASCREQSACADEGGPWLCQLPSGDEQGGDACQGGMVDCARLASLDACGATFGEAWERLWGVGVSPPGGLDKVPIADMCCASCVSLYHSYAY